MPWRKLLASVLLACGLIGCGSTSTPLAPTATSLIGRITFAGSTTVQPLADKLGTIFKQDNPGMVLDIAAGGSMVGIKAVHDGTADIGMASRALTSDEAKGIKQDQIALDVLAIVVHPTNPVSNLTRAQLRDIYLGKLTNWKDVGGPDQPIQVIVRDTNSGTRGAFDEIVLEKQAPQAPRQRSAFTAGDVAALVAADPQAIGYVGFGNLEPSLKLLTIDDVRPTKDTARSGTYKLVRPLLLLTGPLTQPLAQTYIDFVLSTTGQKLVEADGWIPVQ
jgi:phosphate transport system substrate-binding protein